MKGKGIQINQKTIPFRVYTYGKRRIDEPDDGKLVKPDKGNRETKGGVFFFLCIIYIPFQLHGDKKEEQKRTGNYYSILIRKNIV